MVEDLRFCAGDARAMDGGWKVADVVKGLDLNGQQCVDPMVLSNSL